MTDRDAGLLRVLRQRGFALLWFGQLISKLGDWVLWIALPFYVYGQTGSALATGIMFIVQTMPPLLLGSLAGVLVDRWDRKRTMVIADLLRFIIVLLLIVARSPEWLWVIYPLAFAETSLSQFFNPAKSAILPRLVGKQRLAAANTLNAASDHLTMLVGPALGGLLVGSVGLIGILVIDAASYLVSGVMISLISLSHEPGDAQWENAAGVSEPTNWTDVWRDWLAGLRLVKNTRPIAALFTTMGVAMLGQGIISVLWVVFVRVKLGGGALEYGWVQVAVATGGMVGAIIMGRVRSLLPSGWLIGVSGVMAGLLLWMTFNLPSLPVILGLQVLTGVVAVGFFVPIQTLLQMGTADRFLGRVFGAFHTTNALLMLVGQTVGSLLGDRFGIVPMLNLSAVLYFGGGAVALLCLLRKVGGFVTTMDRAT